MGLKKAVGYLLLIVAILIIIGGFYLIFNAERISKNNTGNESTNGANIVEKNAPETPKVVLPYYYVNRGNGTITIKVDYDIQHAGSHIDVLEDGYSALKGRCNVIPLSRRVLSFSDGETNEYSVDINGTCNV
jgi:hypothetical protein